MVMLTSGRTVQWILTLGFAALSTTANSASLSLRCESFTGNGTPESIEYSVNSGTNGTTVVVTGALYIIPAEFTATQDEHTVRWSDPVFSYSLDTSSGTVTEKWLNGSRLAPPYAKCVQNAVGTT